MTRQYVIIYAGRCARTALNSVGLGVVPYIGCLRLGDLHLTVLLCFGQREILFIPLQAASCERSASGNNALRLTANSLVSACGPALVERSSESPSAWSSNATLVVGGGLAGYIAQRQT